MLGSIFRKNESQDIVKEKREVSTFSNITIKSANVEKDLKKISEKYDIDIKELDFTIIAYKTFYRFSKEEKYKPLNEIQSDEIFTKENLLNPDFEIRQQYKLNVYKKKGKGFVLKINLGANKDFTKIYAVIKKNSSVAYHEKISNDIITEINKKKVRQGILIGILDNIMTQNIQKVVSHLMVNKGILEDIQILVCEGIDRFEEQKEIVNLLFKEKKVQENKSKSLREQSNLSTVKEGETVIEVIKSQKGQNGRNCKGEFLPMQVTPVNNELSYDEIKLSDNFIEKENTTSIKIIAKKDGYIIQDGNKFDISDDIVVDQVNLRTTGSIRANDKDIKINIENNDDDTDAIASGIVLDTKEVKAKGNVGSNAKINANIVEIEGQTHQTSQIFGKRVKVNLHKGFIESDRVDIRILEGGRVVCDEAYIDTFSGGEIKAKRIYVNRLISNSTLMASHSIEIEQLDGDTNKIIIDPRVQRGYEDIVENLNKEIKHIEFEISRETKELKSLKRKILSEQDTIKEIKARIEEFKRMNIKTPAAMLNKLKSDTQNKIQFNKIVAYIKDLKQQVSQLQEKLKLVDEAIFDSYIVLKSSWKEYNEIIFKMVNPKKNISRFMTDGEKAHKLGLKVIKENEYIIANL